ncbi:hypothetical protein BDV26DRAFT_284190 [Aspergillus bertholletiae]|uniref:N-acetyltransferase domain-containing protein n=1 Tax=Aspergillus bertholletiae TaxID=1226010 RepID=A0A5N7AXD4_9EURO|nr:hypothetical protein BDV26DRAFT_284190 [Aspergillus bertholletiae]
MSNQLILPPGYILRQGYPPVQDYMHLRSASGLSPQSAAQAEASIRGSWYGCYITYKTGPTTTNTDTDPDIPHTNETTTTNEAIVGMGRVIGDGGWYFHIADMAVLPDHQRKGLGDVILKDLLSRIRSLAPPPERAADGRLMGTYKWICRFDAAFHGHDAVVWRGGCFQWSGSGELVVVDSDL